jgi:amino acid adenylation domain-containing protein
LIDSIISDRWNPANFDPSPGLMLSDMFERWVDRQPYAPAVTAGEVTVSYSELNETANRLAHRLIAQGVGAEVVVAVALPRGALLVAGILAVLKAGGAYVPIDPTSPVERMRFILEDSASVILLSSAAISNRLSHLRPPRVLVEDVLGADKRPANAIETQNPVREHPTSGAQAAYIIYTSGSTGRPKGVCVPHANVRALLRGASAFLDIHPSDVWSWFHSCAFDFSVWEIFGALLTGGRLVVIDDTVRRNPEEFLSLLSRESVSILSQTPSAFYALIEADRASNLAMKLRYVILGGEALEFSRLDSWRLKHGDRAPTLVNMYGITETTVHVTALKIDATRINSAAASAVGVPLLGWEVHVLDEFLQPAEQGEIYVGGAGLARGYLGQPGLTAERFIASPFGPPGARLYRSGDLARRCSDGGLEFLGRADQQVKIRGFRIEPGEIEAALAAHPAIAQAAVAARSVAGEPRLYGYIVWKPNLAQPPLADIRSYLLTRLPDYMVPARLIALEALPRTANDKLDVAALPAPGADAAGGRAAPPTRVEPPIGAGAQDSSPDHRLAREERERLLFEWNATDAEYPGDRCVHELFEAQAARTPDRVALVFEGRRLTYAALNAKANRLARRLRALDVKPDDRVAICLERSLEMVIGILGVLKAGGAYVPLDPGYPVERLSFMVADSSPIAVLAHRRTRPCIDAIVSGGGISAPVIDLDDDAPFWTGEEAADLGTRDLGLRSDHLAYVIYTSGSTGRPKGVMTEHRAVVNRLWLMRDRFGIDEDERVLQKTPFSFDVSVWELLWPITVGARLVIARPEGHKDPAYLLDTIEREGVTLVAFVPSMLRAFLESLSGPTNCSLRHILCGGEAMTLSLARLCLERLPATALYNAYGPTEAAIDCVGWTVSLEPGETETPIGRPFPNTRVYILEPNGDLAPIGAIGELHIGGAQVSRGYLNRPDLTAERFIDNPFAPGERLYKTGDLARYRADGNIIYLGRNDFQVKIRGFRIELGEIEARLAAHPGVREAVVVAREDSPGEKQLTAYYLARNNTDPPTHEALRAHLATALPDYMVPAAFVRLDAFPVTFNGKLDREALPAMADQNLGHSAFEPPQGVVEAAVARIWAEVLRVQRVVRRDSFFGLGGDSLLMIRAMSRLRREGYVVEAADFFAAPDLIAAAGATRRAEKAPAIGPENASPQAPAAGGEAASLARLAPEDRARLVREIPGGAENIQDVYPLAPLQEGILFHHAASTQGDPYLLQAILAFDARGRLDAYVAALRSAIERHDALRTSVHWEGFSTPVQAVWRRAPLILEEVTLADPVTDAVEAMRDRFDPHRVRLDLAQAPLIRLIAARDPVHGGWVLAELVHHLIVDGLTLEILRQEIRSHLLGKVETLPVPASYGAFVAQARAGLQDPAHEQFFTDMLGDYYDSVVPFGVADTTGEHAAVVQARQRLDAEISERVRRSSRDLGVTPASLFHLAWALVVARMTGRDDVVFGTVMLDHRSHGEGAVGMFINTAPIRVRIGEDAVGLCLTRIHGLLASLMSHEQTPLTLARRCAGTPEGQPLFTTLLNYRHALSFGDGEQVELADGIWVLSRYERTTYPITLSVDDDGQTFTLIAQAAAPIDPERVRALMETALDQIACALVDDPRTPARDLDVLPPSERDTLLHAWNATQADYPAQRCVHELFEDQAARAPGDVALLFEDHALAYGELNAGANRLARRLRELGVKPDSRVALCVERGVGMITGLLSIWKAGGACVPLDGAYPPERLARMLEDSECRLILTDAASRALIEAACVGLSLQPPIVDLDADGEDWRRNEDGNLAAAPGGLTTDRLAYVIFTSGSTGGPKGVAMPGRALVNLLTWQARHAPLEAGSAVLQFASFGFDVAFQEILSTLVEGGRLVLIRDAVRRDPGAIAKIIDERQITRIYLPPAYLDVLTGALGGSVLPSLREIFAAGDVLKLTPSIAAFLHRRPDVALHNHYGPSETHVAAAHTVIGPPWGGQSEAPIGRPIANTRLYLLDQQRRLAPIGTAGELYIAGDGLARGYINDADLTAERFIESPFASARLYRTGDLARYLPTGDLEFLGRDDFQVKIRGFRVELGEIEARLRAHGAVRDAVVLAREDVPGDRRLVAYYAVRAGADPPTVEDLASYLAATLPDFMTPAAFVRLDHFPLNPNGKIDRHHLPVPDAQAFPASDETPPSGPMEAAVAEVWAAVLGRPKPRRRDSFFALGGHSLLAMRAFNALRPIAPDLKLADIFNHPILADLAARMEAINLAAQGTPAVASIPPRGDQRSAPLSYAQESLWFVAQSRQASRAYHMPVVLRLEGALETPALTRALDDLWARHDALRSRFRVMDGDPVQTLDSAAHFPLVHLSLDPAEADAAVAAFIAAPFNLADGPLARAALIRLAAGNHLLVLVLHHIISDGWSMGVLRRDLSDLYNARIAGQGAALSPLAVQYGDFSTWQRTSLDPERRAVLVKFWSETLANAPTSLKLPLDRPRPAQRDFLGGFIPLDLGREVSDRLAALARRRQVTLNMIGLAAWALVLSRLSGQESVIIGSPSAGRVHPEVEDLIGYFVNMLPLRIDIDPRATLRELLDQVKDRVLAGIAHEQLGLPGIVEAVRAERDPAFNPLFQTLFSFEEDPGDWALNGLTVEDLKHPEGVVAKVDLSLTMRVVDGVLQGGVDYAKALFDEATAHRYAGYVVCVLQALARDETVSLGTVEMLSEAERRTLLVDWNATNAPYPADRCLHELFEDRAASAPDAVALICDGESLTYDALNLKANRLAHHLLALGLGPEDRVALCLERSPALVVAMLAVLKAGGAYVPLDPANPAERLKDMLEECGADVVFVTAKLAPILEDARAQIRRVDPERFRGGGPSDNPSRALTGARPSGLAYVIYTSGSAGAPKGVMVEHGHVVRLATDATFAPLTAEDCVAHCSNPAFDASTWEIWTPLVNGARVLVVPLSVVLAPRRLDQALVRAGVTALWLTSALFNALVDQLPETFGQLNYLLIGGEVLNPAMVARLSGRARRPRRILNGYGPTETTTFATMFEIPASGDSQTSIPIGRPLASTRTYILDSAYQPVPRGAVGELFIGGAKVARGYLNRPALTAERFIDSPFVEGDRLYKTGDLARYLPDGAIEFVGRNDFQVKIRGFRIELGEIEAHLTRYPAVREAVVVWRQSEPGDRRLSAYYLTRPGSPAPKAEVLRDHLQATLPEYMVPAAFVALEAFPLTPNGKLDRAALPPPQAEAFAAHEYRPPQGEIEERLALIWARVLGIERIGRHDNFFDLGGHSLLGLRLLRELEKAQLGQFALGTLLRAQTIAEFAQVLSVGDDSQRRRSLAPLQVRQTGAPIFMVHLIERDLARELGRRHRVYGLSFGLADTDRTEPPPKTVEDLAAHYIQEMRSVQPDGPYRLIGHSFGGLVAFEMARQLQEAGEGVALLGLLDTYPLGLERRRRTFAGAARKLATSSPADLLHVVLETVNPAEFAPLAVARTWVFGARSRDLTRPLFAYLDVPYALRPYRGKIHLFKASRPAISIRFEDRPSQETLWRPWALGGLTVVTLPGRHMDLVRDPVARQTAEAIELALEEAPGP